MMRLLFVFGSSQGVNYQCKNIEAFNMESHAMKPKITGAYPEKINESISSVFPLKSCVTSPLDGNVTILVAPGCSHSKQIKKKKPENARLTFAHVPVCSLTGQVTAQFSSFFSKSINC